MSFIPAFFIALFISLFIPNTAAYTEYFWALILVVLWWQRKTNPHPPMLGRTISITWIGVFTALILTSIGSRSLGSSFLTFIRFTEAFVIFVTMANISKINGQDQFPRWANWFIRATVCSFFLLLLYKPIAMIIPGYNSLTSINGHHPIAYYLIFFLPLIVALHSTNPTRISLFVLLLSGISLILSASRGAILMVFSWLITLLFNTKPGYKHQFMLLSAISGSVTIFMSIFWLSLIPYSEKVALIKTYPGMSLFIKESPGNDPRNEFVNQATTGIRSAPFLGNGPGTFALVSRAFERRPGVYSSYTHSQPLQILSEQGFIGSIPLFFLIGIICVTAISGLKQHNAVYKAACWGLLLTIIYSFFEGNLNGLSVWLLWWAMAGYVMGYTPSSRDIPVINLMRAAQLILILFVTSFTASMFLTRSGGTTERFLSAPYRKSLITGAIAAPSEISNGTMQNVILFFHKRDPDVLMSLATITQNPSYYRRAIDLDPFNYAFWQQALTYHWSHANGDAVETLLCALMRQTIKNQDCTIQEPESFRGYLSGPAFAEALGYLQGNDGLAKFFYFVGLTLHNTTGNTSDSLRFWTYARDVAPQWGYYHLELASSYKYWGGDEKMARVILEACSRHPLASAGCTAMARSPEQLYSPGIYASDIALIPAIQ